MTYMEKFTVEVDVTLLMSIPVQAESLEEAQKKVIAELQDGRYIAAPRANDMRIELVE